ncbi:MAG: cyclic nucleotide-binding domain-containing protein [Armatimonadetes bacterium]|nr:cyclic nucleotide-binding domain-containing protein [Armatimonadota bacterium]
MFSGSASFLEGLAPMLERRTLTAGDVILREGELSDRLYFVERGRVRVASGPQQQVVCELGPGEVLGELSYLDGLPHSATATAVEETTVLILSRASAERLQQRQPELAESLDEVLVRAVSLRLRQTTAGRMLLDRQHRELLQANRELDRLSGELATRNRELTDALEETRRAEAALIRASQMASLGQLVAGAAHELNNPLAALERGAEQLKARLTSLLSDPEMARALAAGLEPEARSTADLRAARREARAALTASPEPDPRHVEVLARLRQAGPEVSPGSRAELGRLADCLELGATLRTLTAAAGRATAVVRALRAYVRPDLESVERVDVRHGLEDTLTVYAHQLQGLVVERQYAPAPAIQARPAELNQVWSNLISNAIEALEGRGRLTIRLGPERGGVRVAVHDTGCGIPPEIAERIFELRFSTWGGRRSGLGLGLSLALESVQRHGGTMGFESRPGDTTFEVWLPPEPPG